MKAFKLAFLLTTLAIGLSYKANAQPANKLTVVIDGIENYPGQICLRIYAREEEFPSSESSGIKSTCTPVMGNSLTQEFSDLEPGKYAIAVIHDQNGDTKLNRDFFGIPEEGFGISNNPPVSIKTGVPKFADASFTLEENTTINISLKYSLDP